MGIQERIEAKLDTVLELLQSYHERLNIIEQLQEEWVSTKQAEKLTGLCGKTLVKEASKENSPIKMKPHGNKNTYERKSLIAFNKQRLIPKILNAERLRDQFLYPGER